MALRMILLIRYVFAKSVEKTIPNPIIKGQKLSLQLAWLVSVKVIGIIADAMTAIPKQSKSKKPCTVSVRREREKEKAK